MKKSLKKNKKGFTLVEMIVVIAIIGVLAAMMVPALLGFVDRAHESNMNAAAAGAGRGVEALLLDPKFSKLTSEDKEIKITMTDTGAVPTTATPDTAFSKEVIKMLGKEGYEKSATIKVEITTPDTTPKLSRVTYAKTGTTVTSASTSNKDIGIYPNK
ncbi:type II secretion system protein [Niameybacter massiliensis]|uniref:type II secretion system protein n=1 Tax=Niameybacter massiliensis TaxID=1658108 RepID=UPI0006B45283|nr:prepilin-type N-terminal cleavage/methylation domain-containing protein [Niameybacter massiliensis]